jgi:putative tryptophan/tyrosine transport system substrate-binding protein
VRLSRRQFVAGAGVSGLGLLGASGVLACRPERASEQRIAFLSEVPLAALPIDAFREGLRQYGYVEGQTIRIDYRSADGELDRLPSLAAELVDLHVALIAAAGRPAIRAARDATTTIPVVMCIAGFDPVAAGLVASLASPGGNVTGVTNLGGTRLVGKRLELLKQAIPGVSRIAYLGRTDNPSMAESFTELEKAAAVLGTQVFWPDLYGPEDLGALVDLVVCEQGDAIYMAGEPFLQAHRDQLLNDLLRNRLPGVYVDRGWVAAGGLMGYGTSQPAQYARAAYYVDRILKGAKPADLPIEQPMTFGFVVNMKTAQALGITFPNEIMLQVTEVIQ